MPAAADFTPQMRIAALGAVPDLRALPPEEIAALAPQIEQVSFARGQVLMKEGDAGDCLYFITDGIVSVQKAGLKTTIEGGGVVGEAALLSGAPRSATVTAESGVAALKVSREAFLSIVEDSPVLKGALTELDRLRKEGKVPKLPSQSRWTAVALRAWEVRSAAPPGWVIVMVLGLLGWTFLGINGHFGWIPESVSPSHFAAARLVIGLFVIQGACEAFVVGVERLGALLRWNGFISGTAGSLVSTLPEFVVIYFLVKVEPLAAFVTAVVTIYNNAFAFGLYSFFLPKSKSGAFAMPRSLTVAGGELLIAAAAVSATVGTMMLVFRVEASRSALAGRELLVIGGVLLGIYAFYLRSLIRHYAEGADDGESHPPDPHRLGHKTSVGAIAGMLLLGTAGAYCGGEAIGGFAETALKGLGLPTIPTAAALAFFAGISEYIIVYKSHSRGELGIALSNVFGGISQVMFLLFPCALIMIGLGAPAVSIPINPATTILMLLLFPLFYALQQSMSIESSISDLDAAALTGIYALLLYFLFTAPA